MTALQRIIRHGQDLHACGMLRDGMLVTEAINALFTAQGREFCQKRAFPSLEDLRALQSEHRSLLKRRRIHIDEGANELLLRGEGTLIAGDVESRVHCEGQGCFDIILAHGARAWITASEYAVVRVTHIGEGCGHEFKRIDNTAVLIW